MAVALAVEGGLVVVRDVRRQTLREGIDDGHRKCHVVRTFGNYTSQLRTLHGAKARDEQLSKGL